MQCVWTTDEDFKQFCNMLRTSELSEDSIEAGINQWVKVNSKANESLTIQLLKTKELENRVKALDFLTPFLEDEGVSELMVNGVENLFVEKGKERLHYELNITEERLNVLIQKIVASVNRAVNMKEPIVDARLRDGSRVHIVLKPIALNGPIITIRKFKKTLNALSTLEKLGCFDQQMTQFLSALVKDRKSIFVSGSTSSGKTTLLNCLCKEIHKDDRVITIEDSAELCLDSVSNLVSLETRTLKQNDLSIISMAELIKASLRMRPDRVIVGEIRGQEAHDMLQAMNTGHEGSMSTGHANSAKDMLQRIETMALSSGMTTVSAIRQQIASGIQYVIHLERQSDGVRRIVEVIQILSCVASEIQYKAIYTAERGWCQSIDV
jgi:pilus assembly protein CpaF